MESINIIIVDDNIQFRTSLKDLLINKCKLNVIAEAADGHEFLKLPKTLLPDIVLMDLSMPTIDGFAATKKYFWDFPKSKIIAVTNHTEMAYLRRMIEVGFKGCIFKSNCFNEIENAIATVMSGALWFPQIVQF